MLAIIYIFSSFYIFPITKNSLELPHIFLIIWSSASADLLRTIIVTNWGTLYNGLLVSLRCCNISLDIKMSFIMPPLQKKNEGSDILPHTRGKA